MTLVKAQAVATAITNGGFQATIDPIRDISGTITEWRVKAHSDTVDVPVNTLKTLQDNQAVTGSVRDAMFV